MNDHTSGNALMTPQKRIRMTTTHMTPWERYQHDLERPEFHKDPADQIIAATARVLDLVLISSDKRLLDYAHVKTLWR